MRQAIAAEDATALAHAAHTLKSSSANVGALGMAELCQELQVLGRAGSIVAAPPLVEQLACEFERVRQALAQECQSTSGAETARNITAL
jgi:HPt (histidine-containing phosphotransfer) domain-containing protein